MLFLDEPTSGLDSTSAHGVIERVHDIARAGSTVILTIHQPSSRILFLLDHLIVLARGQLMYQGSPKNVGNHLGGMGRKVPKGESPVEYLIDVIQEYDQSEHGVKVLASFARNGLKPPPLMFEEEVSMSSAHPTPTPPLYQASSQVGGRRLHLQAGSQRSVTDFDHSLRSPYSSRSWSASHSGIVQTLRFTPSNQRPGRKMPNPMR